METKTINARHMVYSGTANQWATTSVVLLKGEIGLETDTGLFKFGDGIHLYSSLSYANDMPRRLSELESDATHRLTTDSEKATWNAKQNQLTFDTIPTSSSTNPVTSGGIKSSLDLKADKSNTYTKEEVDAKTSSVYKYKGSVPTYEDLPSTGQVIGDVWNVENDGSNYAWDGAIWDKLGGNIDLSNYYTKTENDTLLNGKVDKVSGKGLSSRDFTSTLETKLNGIESGAKKNVQSNWAETNTSSDAYILNKPSIPSVQNGVLTIQRNSTSLGTFSANQSSNKTINIVVPTSSTDLSDSLNIMRYDDTLIINGGEL